MGRQFSIYLTPSDTVALEPVLARIEPVLVLNRYSPTAQPLVMESLEYTYNDRRWLSSYLVRPADLDKVVAYHVVEQGHWLIDELYSPVINISKCFFDGHILRRGRFYYIERYFDENDQLLSKSDEFRAWAKRVFAAVKKSLARKDSDYIGADARRWLESEQGRLVE